MATKRELYELVGKCSINPSFMQNMMTDPIGTAHSVVIELSDEQHKWLASSPSQLKSFVDMVTPTHNTVQGASFNCGTCIVDGH